MKHSNIIALALLTFVIAGSTPADAIPDRPYGARKFSAEFVKHYEGCLPGAVNDATMNPFNSVNACTPPIESVPVCEFDTAGKGKVKMAADVASGDIDYKVKFKKLDVGCIGLEMTYVMRYRQTNNDCATGSGECTTVETDVHAGSCIVSPGGSCSINGTINTDAGGPIFQPGLETSLELHGCGMAINGVVSFVCGLLLD